MTTEKKPAVKATTAATAEKTKRSPGRPPASKTGTSSTSAATGKRTRQPRIISFQKRFEIHLKDLPAEAATAALDLVKQAIDLVLGERKKLADQKKRQTAAARKSAVKKQRLARTLKKYKPEEIEEVLKQLKK